MTKSPTLATITGQDDQDYELYYYDGDIWARGEDGEEHPTNTGATPETAMSAINGAWGRGWSIEYKDTYRAAYVSDTVLTGPEHADLSDEDLTAVAVEQLKQIGAYGDEPHQSTEDDIEIGHWAAE